MKTDELKKMLGSEYPATIVVRGMRLPLVNERRFSRFYYSGHHKLGSSISRFMDGSADIIASVLQNEWHIWTASERKDFCQACSWLRNQADFVDMLRFIMQHGTPAEWAGVAMSVASQLPRDEAFDILLRALRTVEIGRLSAILAQAIAITKHPAADATLRNHLQTAWEHGALWDDDDFANWVAFDATTCIAHLIELGAAPTDFEPQVQQLSQHACAGNRDSCRSYLSKHYGWLKR